MAQYKVGTVDVVNGSQTVTGTGTAWNTSSNVEVGDIFTVDQGVTWYEVGSVDSDTQITLTANFAGTTQNGISYAITRDFTTNLDLPYPNNQDIGTAGILRRALEEVDSVIGGGNGDLSFNDLTVNGLIDLANSGAIQDAGTDAITFDGSQNVDIPNGKLTASGGLETNSGSFQNHITQIVADDSNTTIQLWRDSGGNNIGRLILRNLDGVGAGDVFIDGENSLALSVTGTDAITVDGSQNVDIPNGLVTQGNNDDATYSYTFQSNRSGASQNLGIVRADWNNNQVADILFQTGTDTTNKDDGQITLRTATGGVLSDAVVVDQDTNVDVPNGSLSEQGVRVGPIESGTWTPVLEGSSTAGTQSYDNQEGFYERRGNLVTVSFNIRLLSLDGATAGALRINNLPFNVNSATGYSAGGSVDFTDNWTPPGDYAGGVGIRVISGTSELGLRYYDTTGTLITIDAADISNTYDIRGSITYEVA